MGVLDRVLGGIAETIKLNDRVAGLAGDLKEFAKDLRDMDRRLTRAEAALDLLTKGALKPAPIDVTPGPAAIEHRARPGRKRRNRP